MAIVHKATLSPGKAELIDAWLDGQPWAGRGAVEIAGSYRFDDPAGAVGVEGFLVRRGERLLHVPLTYRAAPLPGAEQALAGRMQHSVLGERWVYPAAADPVATGCFERALRGEQQQASIEIHDGDRVVARRESDVRLRTEGDGGAGAELRLVDDPSADVPSSAGLRLLATVGDVEAVIAYLA